MNKRKWKFNFGSILYLLHFCFTSKFGQNAQLHLCDFTLFSREKRVKFELLSLFSRNEKWNHFPFHSFREMKSELIFDFTLFEKWKWNWKASRSRSRGEIWKKFSRILEKRDSCRLLVQSGKDHLISVVIAKFLYYFPQSIHLSFWFWYMCHWDISFPIFCDIIRPIFGHLPSHFLDAAASLASTG